MFVEVSVKAVPLAINVFTGHTTLPPKKGVAQEINCDDDGEAKDKLRHTFIPLRSSILSE